LRFSQLLPGAALGFGGALRHTLQTLTLRNAGRFELSKNCTSIWFAWNAVPRLQAFF
jgi:hypothetical protein